MLNWVVSNRLTTSLDNGSGEIIDLGCANGDFLHYIKQNVGKNWGLSGIDLTPEYVQVGKNQAGMNDISLEVGDMLNLNKKYDVLLSLGTIQIFPDIENALSRLLDATNEGGYLFISGMFNTYDVDTIFKYHDHSNSVGEGKWRCDFNIHSQKRVGEFLNNKVKNFDFTHLDMDIDLPFDPDAPHIRVHTLKLEDGTRIKTMGGMLIVDQHLLTIQK